MFVIDQDTCIGCAACEAVCPVSAISGNDAGKFEISDACVDCAACEAVCPVSAITG